MNRPLLFVVALTLVAPVAAQDPTGTPAQQQENLKKLVEAKVAQSQPQTAPATQPA